MKVTLKDAERVADLLAKVEAHSKVVEGSSYGPLMELHQAYRRAIYAEINAINHRYLKAQ